MKRGGMRVLATLACAGALGLGGCSDVRQTLGLEKTSPDEFAVVPSLPLVVPSDLATLPPPQPGMQRPQEQTPAAMASTAIFGTNIVGTTDQGAAAPVGLPGRLPPSAGEAGLIQEAASGGVDANIRGELNRAAAPSAETSLVDSIIPWSGSAAETLTVIDPHAEAARLRAVNVPTPEAGPKPEPKEQLGGFLWDWL